eukprot:SAG31_NODE_46955_length_252_cov_0.679739_1_plen_26_part_10
MCGVDEAVVVAVLRIGAEVDLQSRRE